ncbi:carbohydrate ABC transporter permease [Niameybacter massiliensis]|uniref:Carbohydrate ABC transporter permease n=1 Tax=Holtiella tumoricola TaxID=3018743 RepID=A0AA42DRZ2_9FIRM|nr:MULTISPECIES: carbohydrate ABC transporter permease [Lachnospirales]MDA3734183.1 carbohydrate ABC transporter permease [Holtiella tumoricola]
MAKDLATVKAKDLKLKKSSGPIEQFSIGKVFIHIILLLWASTTIFPLVWVLNNSFKLKGTILIDSFSLVKEPVITNYITAFERMNIGRAYMNSLIISGTVVVGVMLFGGLASYILARYNFKGKLVIHSMVMAALLFPAFATIVPVFTMLYNAGLTNTHLGVILPQIAGNLAFAITIMVGFMSTIPMELEEAAVVEGCGAWQIFWKIVVPISKPSFATVAIFTFLWSYNDLFMQKVIIRKTQVRPICALLDTIRSQYGTDYGLMCASVILVVVPVLIVYLFLQKYIIKGLTAGAVKG